MDKDDPEPKTQPSGNRQPPRPPRRTAVGLAPDGDDSRKRGRATITKPAKGEGKFIRQSQYGHVTVEIVPNGKGKGVEIISDVPGSAIPVEYMQSVIDGISYALDGIFVGYPIDDGTQMVDLVVRLVGGSFHLVNSNDISFKMAAIFAIIDAVKNAEPIMIT